MADLVFVFACSCAAAFCALLTKQALAPQQVCFLHLLLLHACNVAYRTVHLWRRQQAMSLKRLLWLMADLVFVFACACAVFVPC